MADCDFGIMIVIIIGKLTRVLGKTRFHVIMNEKARHVMGRFVGFASEFPMISTREELQIDSYRKKTAKPGKMTFPRVRFGCDRIQFSGHGWRTVTKFTVKKNYLSSISSSSAATARCCASCQGSTSQVNGRQ